MTATTWPWCFCYAHSSRAHRYQRELSKGTGAKQRLPELVPRHSSPPPIVSLFN